MKTEEKILQDFEVDALAKAIRPHLDASLDSIKPGIAYRLAEARRNAVASLDAQTATSSNAQGGTLTIADGAPSRLTDWRFWATGLLFSAALATYGFSAWSDYTSAREQTEVDMMILGDDVPVDALLDKGFNHYLREDN
jgi:Protein of unknown function (DUF3619)